MKNKIIKTLSNQDFRITPVREKMVEYFSNIKQPLTAIQILELFRVDKVKVHKATVYREIDFLLSHDVIHSLNLRKDAVSYELNSLSHHHHFVCEKCGDTIDIIPEKVETALRKFETNLIKKEKVKVNYHSLKIFGFCNRCKK
ncbi:MAG: transcriptional repressor [Bacteroidales bacterium]|nr:transcriptional repressor [Bacteroidales bacterium]